jgi:hypothetical protein
MAAVPTLCLHGVVTLRVVVKVNKRQFAIRRIQQLYKQPTNQMSLSTFRARHINVIGSLSAIAPKNAVYSAPFNRIFFGFGPMIWMECGMYVTFSLN